MITGTVVQVTDDDLCVNIGSKSDAIIHKNEISMKEVIPKDLFKVGDEIEAEVISLNDGEGNILLSRKRVEKKQNWTAMQENVGTEKLYSMHGPESRQGRRHHQDRRVQRVHPRFAPFASNMWMT